jgi:Ala-tRNA(Pro) deacylase
MSSNPDLLARVLARLHAAGAEVQHIRHETARSTEALAAARGMPVSVGVKALVMKIRGEFTLIALRADQTLDNRRVRRALKAQKLRFARGEELAVMGLFPGQIPPFGRPILPVRLVADPAILSGAQVAFTAGTSTDSLVMATADWARIAAPEFVAFGDPA